MDFENGFGAINGMAADRASHETAALVEQKRRHLAIVDRSALRRDCLKLALGQQPRRWRVSDFETAAELMRSLRQGIGFSVIVVGAATSWQIDLVDLAMLSAAAGETPILVIAECEDTERARMILRSGAKGFLPMSNGLKVLVAALERVRAGGSFVPLLLSESHGSEVVRETERSPQQLLTKRQRDVLALISEGKSNKLIADALGMSESTVKAHVKQIIRRLHVVNRTQAALLAARVSRPIGAVRAELREGVL